MNVWTILGQKQMKNCVTVEHLTGTNKRSLDWPGSRWTNNKERNFLLFLEQKWKYCQGKQLLLKKNIFLHLHQIPTLVTVYNEKSSVWTNYVSSEILLPLLLKWYLCKATKTSTLKFAHSSELQKSATNSNLSMFASEQFSFPPSWEGGGDYEELCTIH